MSDPGGPPGPQPWERPADQPSTGETGAGSPAAAYDTQALSEVHAVPRRRRGTAFRATVVLVVVLVVAGAVAAWLLTRPGGEETRAEYCRSLQRLTHDGDLMAAAQALTLADVGEVQHVVDVAPDAVADDWQALQALVRESGLAGDVTADDALDAVGHLQVIRSDAQDECDLELELPMGF